MVYHVALLSDRRGLVATWVQPARPELLAERLTPLREGIAQVAYEAGPTGFALVRHLRAEGFRAEVIAPAKTPVTPGAEPKTHSRPFRDGRPSSGLEAQRGRGRCPRHCRGLPV